MKPPRFRHYDARTVDEAVELLAEHGDDAKVLAGGQSLIPMMSLRLAYPEVLVDINRTSELDYVSLRDGELAIGALTRHSTLERSGEVADSCPLVSAAMPWVAHEAIRNRGTIGGSLAHADPAAELPAVALALDASVVVKSRDGLRTIPIDEFFRMPFVVALRDGELVTEIRLPVQAPSAGSAVREIARRRGDFALAGVVASVVLEHDRVAQARVVGFAAAPTPRRLAAVEEALVGARVDEELDPTGDVHASAEYRRAVMKVLTARALVDAIDEARAHMEEES
jgi:aerobic carbon-monoxide dehydrogenase medium subunit